MAVHRETVYPVVGVVHLPPLPGSARGGSARRFDATLDAARRDAAAWAEGGAAALMVENFGDVPFARDAVPPHVVAAMTVVVDALRRETGLPIGVNVLRNDVLAAIGIAALAGGSFVRANVYVGAALTDQGIIEGRAHEAQALIRSLDAPVAVWADVDVKHAAPLAARPLADLAEDAIVRGLAGALIVTGRATGQPADVADLREVRQAVPRAPLYVGSGATVARMPELLAVADGVIVGTAAKFDGDVANPVDPARVRALVEAARATREARSN
jgi:membrane complex biogenesis BtpA family protein